MGIEIVHGDCLDVLRGLPDASIIRKRLAAQEAA